MLSFNIGLLAYCYLLFSPYNFIYSVSSPERIYVLEDACQFLLKTHYFWWANSFNILLFGIYWALTYQWKSGLAISAAGIFFYFTGLFLFQESIQDRYYTLFRYQSVPDELVSQPARLAGTSIANRLKKDLKDPDDLLVKNAIRALGAIKDESVVDTLSTILNNWDAPEDLRFESYFALKQIGSSRSEEAAEIFIGAHHEIKDKKLMDRIRKFDF